jgi:acyl-CoA thioester hydrolase
VRGGVTAAPNLPKLTGGFKGDGVSEGQPIEVWRGAVAAWECDEMGHMNVRFHLARAMQGLAAFAAALGMPNAFGADAAASLVVRGHHIRFLREARAGAPLHMTAGVLAMDESAATLIQTLTHSRSGEVAAHFVTRLVHATAQEGRAFPWPQRAVEAARGLTVALPADAGPRGVPEAGPAAVDGNQAQKLPPAARGVVAAEDCDVFGRMRTELVLGWIAQAIPHMVEPFRQEGEAVVGPGGRVGGAALEYRLSYFGAPGPGDLLEVRSGLVELGHKLGRMRHWLIDPRTGAAWAEAENLSVNFDLDTRKAVALSPEAVARLRAHVVSL